MMQPTKALLGHKVLLSVAVIYTIAITVASLAPTSELPKINYEFADKWAHLLIHAVLFFVWASGLEMINTSKLTGKTMTYVLLGCFGYGIIIEILQEVCTTYRNADMFDVVANILGSLLGLLIFLTRRKIITN